MHESSAVVMVLECSLFQVNKLLGFFLWKKIDYKKVTDQFRQQLW